MKPETGPLQLVISEPEQWFSQLDEGMFYRALYAITSIKSLEKVPKAAPDAADHNWIVLQLNAAQMDDTSLKNMVGLLQRYEIDASALATQCSAMNERWFKSKDASWYKAVFGRPVTV